MKVTYLHTITTPFKKAGKKGETKEVPNAIAKVLIAEGHVKPFDEKEIVDDSVDKGTNLSGG